MAYDLSKLRILLVDHQTARRALVQDVLKVIGVEFIETAPDGSSAYSLFRSTMHDIVITERVMRPLDGLELTRMIRNDASSPNPTVPILMLTAMPSLQDVIRARDSGVTEFMIMPFSVEGLYRRLVAIIEQPRQFVRVSDYFGPDRRRSGPK